MQSIKPIHIAIAHRDPLARSALRTLLELEPDMAVVFAMETGSRVAEACAQDHPRVLLYDINTPGIELDRLVAEIRARSQGTAVLALAYVDDDVSLALLMAGGCSGILLKTQAPKDAVDAVRRVAGGDVLFTREQQARAWRWQQEVQQPWSSLTKRERQLAQMLAQGKSNSEMAAELTLDLRTVEGHISQIITKLNTASRLAVVVWMRDQLPETWWRRTY